MIWQSIILLIIGAGFVIAELCMPGFGICGIVGIISILGSAILTVLTVPFGFVIILLEIAVLALFFYIVWTYLKRKQLYGKLILNETLNKEEKEIGGLDYFMGKEGLTKTPLKPFGSVDFNGSLVEVWSEGVYIPENQRVKVVAVTDGKIIVRQVKLQ